MNQQVFAFTLLLLAAAAASALRAETFPYDHMHFDATDPAAAVAWYAKNIPAKLGSGPDRVVIGRTIFAFAKVDNPLPSAGSAIDHIGISVANVDEKMKELAAAGAKVTMPARTVAGLPRSGFVQDPFGISIELLQDPEALGFHHVHLRVADPDAELKWFSENYGGERIKWKGRVDAVRYTNPTVLVLADKSDNAAPSQGHAIDHLGWAVTNVDTKVSELAAKGLKTEAPRGVRNLRVGFVYAPGGVRIEMVQGRTEEELVGH
jgi:catechol 2,3-dioxygenase-like lactoylglutathione lyase family enzyme